ncbi:MAG TPA: nuclear transport factor 2 family protein [Gemmatimonadaceae bacterium]|nr:nuclear transport factor 2 family protein [Gemmatimonadaceae bacterium]
MSANRRAVERYMAAYDATDRPAILAELADDVEWVVPGAFHLRGKREFEREIDNPAFVGRPAITLSRVIAEGDVVVAEGRVVTTRRDDGKQLTIAFCDVFEMRDGRIVKLTSYLAPLDG